MKICEVTRKLIQRIGNSPEHTIGIIFMKKIKPALLALFRVAVLKPVLYIWSQLPEKKKTTFDYVWERAKSDSADFIHAHISKALVFKKSPEIWAYAMSQIPAEGSLLEFGVFKGASINFFSATIRQRGDTRTFYGFDSFDGLQEDWSGHFRPASSYSLDSLLPPVNENVRLVKGMVQDTLLPFLADKGVKEIAFLHIDTDTYTPCKYVLENTVHLWKVGTVILFDELIGYPGWKEHEFKAWQELLAERKIGFDYIGFADEQALIRITEI